MRFGVHVSMSFALAMRVAPPLVLLLTGARAVTTPFNCDSYDDDDTYTASYCAKYDGVACEPDDEPDTVFTTFSSFSRSAALRKSTSTSPTTASTAARGSRSRRRRRPTRAAPR